MPPVKHSTSPSPVYITARHELIGLRSWGGKRASERFAVSLSLSTTAHLLVPSPFLLDYRLLPIDYRLLPVDYRPLPIDYRPLTVDYRLLPVDYRL